MDRPLAQQTCQPCQLGSRPLPIEDIRRLLPAIPRWQNVQVDGTDRLRRDFHFRDFDAAFAFAQQVAALAQRHDHHPLLEVEWGRVGVTWWTHKINGLHQNDFIMAAKTDLLAESAR